MNKFSRVVQSNLCIREQFPKSRIEYLVNPIDKSSIKGQKYKALRNAVNRERKLCKARYYASKVPGNGGRKLRN